MKQFYLPLFLFLFLFGCLNKTPVSEENKEYIGLWTANNDYWISIGKDGTGSYKLPNSNISGGSATIKEKSITISMLGIDANFVIDQPPHQEEGTWLMILDGIKYYKQ